MPKGVKATISTQRKIAVPGNALASVAAASIAMPAVARPRVRSSLPLTLGRRLESRNARSGREDDEPDADPQNDRRDEGREDDQDGDAEQHGVQAPVEAGGARSERGSAGEH